MQTDDEEVVQPVGADDVFETPTIEVPPSPPEAHRAVITAVTLKRIESREDWPIIEIGLRSLDVPTLEDRLGIFVPKAYEEGIKLGKDFHTDSLPQATPKGQKSADFFGDQQTMFQRNIGNSENTATLQVLVSNPDSLARSAGRNPAELGLVKALTLEDYVANVEKMLVGVECIMLRREKGGDDPAFRHTLQTNRLVPFDTPETNPKSIKNYVKAWESA